MSSLSIFLSIIAALSIGAISPGPSFVLVSRIAMSRSRLDGLAAALGMGIGGVAFSILALAGLTALLSQFEWLYLVLKVAGGAYLVYMAFKIWRGAREPIHVGDAGSDRRALARSFTTALLTQVSNPKTIVVYASIFAALLPKTVPLGLILALPIGVFAVEAGWYTVVALAFSARHPRRLYLAAKTWIDRLAGTVMAGLGVQLVTSGLAGR
ncbi:MULTISPECIES: LysE family translocator [unclassified Rhizobium]|uniref:LysE family translocator n=1 Tax=unclassified Rhizobium TaxID=2613769 RepID=UPI0002715C7F|nr:MULTISPECIES: LysE family translocator [unclassified Rhizobium]EJL52049.1 putative threonine efflux protein [Rhizobium sp. CF122]MBB3396597.1 threonine/homoserine/homoserine lactone efflux protein [Rhizobium sp. BK060]MBB4166775.1 threonine/homoserine/homoserine lactone efflux protein [Rhizobium sp. BK538]TCM77501.1 threonine/homoserine/homoserine lactone efflux protein [Rhizobium sp. BK068]